MGPFGLGLVIWNEEYHIWVVLKKRWILISILTIFGDSQFFTFFMTWRMTWRFGKRARDLTKRETRAIFFEENSARESEKWPALWMAFWWNVRHCLVTCFWYLPILNKQVTYSHILDLYIKGCEDENFTTSLKNTNSVFWALERERAEYRERKRDWSSHILDNFLFSFSFSFNLIN